MTVSPQPKWSEIKKALFSPEAPEPLALIKELFDLSVDNKHFLGARLLAGASQAATLEVYSKRIVDAFFPARGPGKPNLGVARKAIRDYRRITSDLGGTLELMMIYMENGTLFAQQYGAIDEALYNSLESVLRELIALLTAKEGRAYYPEFQERLLELEQLASNIGWGYGDFVRDITDHL